MEKEKLKKFLDGDLDLFHEFYEETKQQVFYNILSVVQDKHLAEDILQETFIKFLEKLPRIKHSSNPIGYLFKISRNLSLDFIKARKKETLLTQEQVENIHHHDSKVEDVNDLMKEVRQLLNPHEYEVVILHTVNEFTHKEIAKITKKPLGSITWTYNNAIKKLQKGLAHYE